MTTFATSYSVQWKVERRADAAHSSSLWRVRGGPLGSYAREGAPFWLENRYYSTERYPTRFRACFAVATTSEATAESVRGEGVAQAVAESGAAHTLVALPTLRTVERDEASGGSGAAPGAEAAHASSKRVAAGVELGDTHDWGAHPPMGGAAAGGGDDVAGGASLSEPGDASPAAAAAPPALTPAAALSTAASERRRALRRMVGDFGGGSAAPPRHPSRVPLAAGDASSLAAVRRSWRRVGEFERRAACFR